MAGSHATPAGLSSGWSRTIRIRNHKFHKLTINCLSCTSIQQCWYWQPGETAREGSCRLVGRSSRGRGMQENVRWGGRHHHYLQCHHHHYSDIIIIAVSSSSFHLFTLMVLRPSHLLHKVSHTISSRCIACRFHHCLRSQPTQLSEADIHFAYIWSASVFSISACRVVTLNIVLLLSQGRHEARPCARRLPDQREVTSQLFLSCNLFFCKVQKGSAAQGGGEEEPDGGQGASDLWVSPISTKNVFLPT